MTIGEEELNPVWTSLFEDAELQERCRRHFQEPHVSVWSHCRARNLELGASVLGQVSIYLDLKYWIFCRDAMLGCPQKPIHKEIWNRLQHLVGAGRAVCPVTYPILCELCKQGPERRAHNARVIDQLSRNVAIQPFAELTRIELYRFFESLRRPPVTLYPLRRLVWTFAGWVGGLQIPSSPQFGAENDLALQKSHFDTIAATPFSYLIDAISDAPPPFELESPDDDKWLNEEVCKHAGRASSFEGVFRDEVAGYLDARMEEIASLSVHQFTSVTGLVGPPIDSDEVQKSARLRAGMILEGYRLKKWTTELPELHINAGIHAAIRYRREKFKKGDHWDHMHAHPALAYCDAFFTEKRLAHLLTDRPLEYDRVYDCRVLWNEDSVLEYLHSVHA